MKPLRITKTSKFRNVLLLLLVVLLFAFILYQNVYKQEPLIKQQPLTLDQIIGQRQQTITTLTAKYSGSTIEYYDQDYGFSIRYPIGYLAEQDPLPGIKVRFSAYFPPFESEVIDIRILNESDLSRSDIYDGAADANVSVLEVQQNGRTAYLMSFQEPSPITENEQISVRQAFVECGGQGNSAYWLSFTAAFTPALAPDLELAEYMISTIQC